MILITNRRGHRFKTIELTSKDLAISSICLNESVITLKSFIKKCVYIDLLELTRMMKKPTSSVKKEYMIWNDGSIVLLTHSPSALPNWETLNMLYSLYSVTEVSYKFFQKIVAFNESRSMSMALYRKEKEDYHIKITNHILNFYSEQIHYFNAKKLVRLAEAVGVNASISDDKVLFRYKDVELQSLAGTLFYNEIFVFIKDFQIDGFMLRFKDFDFSSYWNIPVILHPFLSVPYGFNNHLDFIPPQNYAMLIEAITEMVKVKMGEAIGFKEPKLLIQDFQDLRRIWAGNKMLAKERIELSKTILRKKVEFDKDE